MDLHDSMEASQVFRPRWKVNCGANFEDPATCSEFLVYAVPPGERIARKIQPSGTLYSDAVFHQVQALYSELATAAADRDWLLKHTICKVAQHIISDDDLTRCVGALVTSFQQLGHKTGFQYAVTHLRENLPPEAYVLHAIDVEAEYTAAEAEYDSITFPILSEVAQYAKEENDVQLLRNLFEPSQVGPSTALACGQEDSAVVDSRKSVNDVD